MPPKSRYDAIAMFRHRIGDQKPSPPKVNIYLNVNEAHNNNRMQAVFDFMRSGEWLSSIAARELFGMQIYSFTFVISQLRRRGWHFERQTLKIGGKKRTYSQYRLLNWEPR